MSKELLLEALADAHSALTKLEAVGKSLLGIGESDATDLAHQAETAAEPVVQAAEADGEQLAQTAAADVEAVLPAPAATTPAPDTSTSPTV